MTRLETITAAHYRAVAEALASCALISAEPDGEAAEVMKEAARCLTECADKIEGRMKKK